jgi:serine/threonine protein kinase
MEYAPGGSLHAAVSRSPRPLPEEAIWRVLLHTALALHHMHSRWARRGEESPAYCGMTQSSSTSQH